MWTFFTSREAAWSYRSVGRKKKKKKGNLWILVDCSFIIGPVLSFLQIMIVFIDFDLNLIKPGFFNSFKILDFF